MSKSWMSVDCRTAYLQEDWVGFELLFNAINRKSQTRNKRIQSFQLFKKKIPSEKYPMWLLKYSLSRWFVHLIQKTDTGNVVFFSLSPHSQCLCLQVCLGWEKQQLSEGKVFFFKLRCKKTWILTSTPAEASNTATAPSRTRSARSTSSVKSTCPVIKSR